MYSNCSVPFLFPFPLSLTSRHKAGDNISVGTGTEGEHHFQLLVRLDRWWLQHHLELKSRFSFFKRNFFQRSWASPSVTNADCQCRFLATSTHYSRASHLHMHGYRHRTLRRQLWWYFYSLVMNFIYTVYNSLTTNKDTGSLYVTLPCLPLAYLSHKFMHGHDWIPWSCQRHSLGW